MKRVKKAKLQGTKKIKRAFYKGRVTKFKRLVCFMIVAGMAASLLYLCKYVYVEYAVSRADIVLTYPEIAQSRYPDGSRFTYYEFIDDENIASALEIMKKDGKYANFTVDDLRDKFYLYSYLDGSAGASVSSARSEGNDFSYVANEYKITFVQPHDYRNSNVKEKILSTDYSGDFLKALVEVNRKRIAEETGGVDGFRNLTQITNVDNYDYSEKLRIYKTKINTIMSYLEYLDKKEAGFVSAEHDMSIKDIEGKYDFLITDKLDGISNFIESSGISKDVEQASNKIKVNIENNQLKYNKFFDRAQINNFAMTNYDHTFTENLINVVQNKDYGLYQARPKTAFDSVVAEKHKSDESVAEYGAKINQFNEELAKYDSVVQTPEEHERLSAKCETLITDFEKAYAELSELACDVVEEYHNEVNESYITAKITKKSLISKNLIIKTGIVFMLGAVIAFVVVVLISSANDSMKVKRRKRLMNSIKRTSKERSVR